MVVDTLAPDALPADEFDDTAALPTVIARLPDPADELDEAPPPELAKAAPAVRADTATAAKRIATRIALPPCAISGSRSPKRPPRANSVFL